MEIANLFYAQKLKIINAIRELPFALLRPSILEN